MRSALALSISIPSIRKARAMAVRMHSYLAVSLGRAASYLTPLYQTGSAALGRPSAECIVGGYHRLASARQCEVRVFEHNLGDVRKERIEVLSCDRCEPRMSAMVPHVEA